MLLTTSSVNHGHALLTPLLHHKTHTHTDSEGEEKMVKGEGEGRPEHILEEQLGSGIICEECELREEDR